MKDLYEVTLKKANNNPHGIYKLAITLQGLGREEALFKAIALAKDLGCEFRMSYIIREFRDREEGS